VSHASACLARALWHSTAVWLRNIWRGESAEETMRVEVARALTGTAALLLQDAAQAPVASQLIMEGRRSTGLWTGGGGGDYIAHTGAINFLIRASASHGRAAGRGGIGVDP